VGLMKYISEDVRKYIEIHKNIIYNNI